ncbi:MAG: hypothetical protein ACHQET_05220 [Chitinophagales bacterium]
MKNLRTFAITLTVLAAMGSLYLMFKAAPNQHSIVLIFLFTSWVLSPFLALILVQKILIRGSTQPKTSIYWIMIILSIISLFAYSGIFSLPGTRPAFPFLMVPLFSWFIIGIRFFLSLKSPLK